MRWQKNKMLIPIRSPQIVAAQAPAVVDNIPQTVLIDEYEQVKRCGPIIMKRGEVPVTENIKTRDVWVNR